MKNYEKPVAEVLLFRLAEVRMIPRHSIAEGVDTQSNDGSGDNDGDSVVW